MKNLLIFLFVCLFICLFVCLLLCVCGCCFSSSAEKVRTNCRCTLETTEPGAREMTPLGIHDKCNHILYIIIYIWRLGWGYACLDMVSQQATK